MGTTGGGVFKSLDGGQSWAPVTDKYFGGTIGSIAVSESDPDVVYVGTGEHAIRGNVSHGDGMFKTTDDGKSWTFIGLANSQQISRVRVHPTNPNIVWVAVFGHVYGPNADRGVYKTTDGGKSFFEKADQSTLLKRLKDGIFVLQINNGLVTKIKQQFLP